jgi:hypothetical protein
MILTRIWKNGTASIIIDPFPPGNILPPREKMSWDTMHLGRQMGVDGGGQTDETKNIETPNEPKS